MTPLLYAIAAGLAVALGSVVEKAGLATSQPYAGMFVRASAVLVFLGLSAAPFGRQADWSGLTGRVVVFLALGGVLGGLVAHLLYWQSLKATGPEFAVPIMLGTSQAAVVVLSAAILGARVSMGQVGGIGLVIVGIALIQAMRPEG